MMLCWLVIAACCTAGARGWGGYPRPRVPLLADGDPGAPLFLTPLLEQGQAARARRLARVPATDELGVESYAGLFTVNRAYNSNLFAWYFPPLARDLTAPLVLWLQGGPGASSLFGLFEEHGPVVARGGRLARRDITWARYHHMVYLDNPVGTGFSFTNSSAGLCRDESCVARGVRAALLQLATMFPELAGRKLFVTGESYAGKYVPAVCAALHAGRGAGGPRLAGLAIGNGLTDPLHQLHYAPYLYQHGLLDAAQARQFDKQEERVRVAIRAGNYTDAFHIFDSLLNGDLIAGKSLFYNMTGFEYYFNILQAEPADPNSEWTRLVGSSAMRRALHVGGLEFGSGREVEAALADDVMRSQAQNLASLLAHYPVLVYNGQLDIIVAYPLTEAFLRSLRFPGAREYAGAARRAWRVEGKLAGYVRAGGNLTEVLVRNAGHMVPADQPLWALDLITRFTRGKAIASPAT